MPVAKRIRSKVTARLENAVRQGPFAGEFVRSTIVRSSRHLHAMYAAHVHVQLHMFTQPRVSRLKIVLPWQKDVFKTPLYDMSPLVRKPTQHSNPITEFLETFIYVRLRQM